MRWVAGLLLIVTAILKAIQLVSETAATLTSPLGGWLLPMQVGVELGIGLFVLSGLYWRQLRWIALAIFAAFAAYSLSLALVGAASCGCFGPIKVHPWWTFLLDMAIVLGLLVSMRRSQRESPRPFGERLGEGSQQQTLDCTPSPILQGSWTFNTQCLTGAVVALSVLSTALLVRYADSRTASADGLLTKAGDLVILEPEKWIGKPLPIAEFIDHDLSRGDWIVLLHRHDCPDCEEAVPHYERLAIARQVALVEVPPYGEPQAAASGAAHCGRLNADREWFVQTPVEIQLTDGVVTSASTELPALLSSMRR